MDAGGWRVTDLNSKNSTLVNGEKITDSPLKNGDILRIGDTSYKCEIEPQFCEAAPKTVGEAVPTQIAKPRADAIAPRRTLFHATAFATLSMLLMTIVVTDFSWDTSTAVGDYWSHRFSRKASPEPQRKTVVADHSPNVPNDRLPLVTRNSSLATDKVPSSPDLADLSRHAFESLVKDVRDALAAGEFEKAESLVVAFGKSPLSGGFALDLFNLNQSIAGARKAHVEKEREIAARREARFKEIEAKVRQAVADEDFDGAKSIATTLTDDPRAQSLAALVDKAREEHIAQRLPQRRDAFAELVLRLRPALAKRDYAAAMRTVESLTKDSAFKSHLSLLDRERETLTSVGKLHQQILSAVRAIPKGTKVAIVQKDGKALDGKFSEFDGSLLWIDYTFGIRLTDISMTTLVAPALSQSPNAQDARTLQLLNPLTLAHLYLHDEDFVSASSVVARFMADPEVDYAVANDLLIRIAMTRNVLMKNDLENTIAEVDRRILAGKYDAAKRILDQVRMKYTLAPTEGIALTEHMATPLPGLEEAYARLEKAGESKMAGLIPVSRLKIFREPGREAEKANLLKNLKVAGDKEVIPYVLSALKDSSSRVRLEAVRTLSVLGSKEHIWDLLGASGDPIREVGFEAVEGIEKIGYNPEAIKQRFATGTPEERRLAIILAGNLRDGHLSSTAIEGLASDDWQMRMESAIALAKIKDKNAGSALVTALKKESADDVASAIAYALGAIKYGSGVNAIADLLKTRPDHPYKKELIRAVAAIGGTSADDVLNRYIRDLDPWVRSTALEGVVESGGKLTLKEAKPLLADDRWLVRAGAMKGLIAGGSDDALDPLILALDDANEAVRATAHHGLKLWKNGKVVPAILKQIDNLRGAGLELALDVLKAVSGKTFATAAEWKAWWRTSGLASPLVPVTERYKIAQPERRK